MATKIVRERNHNYGVATTKGRERALKRATNVWTPWTGFTSLDAFSLDGTQVTESEKHDWPPKKGGFSGDAGGAFFSKRRYATLMKESRGRTQSKTFPTGPDAAREYHENCFYVPIETAGGLKPLWPTFLHSADADLVVKGATAIAQCKPTNASSNLLVALAETVKDGLPSIIGSRSWRDRALTARNAGDEYLNKEFGWDPLIHDISSFADTIRNSEKIISQYERDMGKLVRRRRNLPTQRTVTETILSGSKSPTSTIYSVTGAGSKPFSPGVWSVRDEQLRQTWFSGAFSYGVPLNSTGRGGIASLAAMADKLFGLSLTPDVLWEITPWSWAIDWFSNTGDVLSNLSDVATQGLVMHYGYLMEHTVHTRTYSLDGVSLSGMPFPMRPVSLVSETKKRIKANPFGFGVSWEGLSPFQLSIAAALGISRS